MAWKCFILLKLIGRFFLGSKLLNRQIFMEPGILTIPAYSLGVLIEVEFGRFTVEFPGEKKNTGLWLEWNIVCERFLGSNETLTEKMPNLGWLMCWARDPKYWAFLQRKIQRGSISLPLYPQELAFWSLNWVIWKPGLKRNSMSGWSQGQSG